MKIIYDCQRDNANYSTYQNPDETDLRNYRSQIGLK